NPESAGRPDPRSVVAAPSRAHHSARALTLARAMATLPRIPTPTMAGTARVRFDPQMLLIFPVFVLSIVVHECAHGLMALWNGDTTARDRGRLTLNPLPHVDPIGSVLLPAALALFHSPVVLGWAKPVPIQWANLRNPRNDPVKVALAGPVSNLLLAVAFAVVVRLAPSADAHGWTA